MDGVKPGRGNHSTRPHARPSIRGTGHARTNSQQRHSAEKYWLVRSLGKVAADYKETLWKKFRKTSFAQWPDKRLRNRVYALAIAGLFVFSVIAAILQPFLESVSYKLTSTSRSVIPTPNTRLGTMLKYKTKEQTFVYNEGYKPTPATAELKKTGNGDPRISASFAKDAKQGVTISDPVNNLDVTLKPKFGLGLAKQDNNQMLYPLLGKDGYLVYTAQIASVKEDILLQSPSKDKLTFDYELSLPEGLEARLEKDGSIGIYGSSLPIYGNVSTGSDKDAELLQKAKQNAEKNKFLFGIPAPVVKEHSTDKSVVQTHYELKGNILTLVAENLKEASYPLAIDPSIYVQTAAQLMYGNNESNVAFDIATEQFKKGFTTGARINNWTENGAMNDATYDQAVAAASGYLYRAGGRSGQIMPYIADKKVTNDATSDTNFTMNMPDTRPAGDLYVAIISTTGSAFNTAPSGWTEYYDSTAKLAVFYKIGANISGGNEASSYSWTMATGSQLNSGVILRIKEFNATTYLSGASPTSTSGSSSVPQYPSITPTTNGSLIISASAFSNDPPIAQGFSPTAPTLATYNYSDIASGHSSGVALTGMGFVASQIDSPPNSSTASGAATLPTAAGVNDNWNSVSIVVNGNTTTAAYNQTLQWSHINNSNLSLESPAPGSDNVACTGWCTNSAYNLPTGSGTADGAGNVGASMVAYNGYLYYMGGYNGTDLKKTVYIAKLGANGEPQLWHPTDPDQIDWVYWHKDTGLSTATIGNGARAYHSAYAYNGKMYVLGGDSDASNHAAGATTAVEIADILPNGTLGSWSNGQALGSARYGTSVQAYNNYLYVIGGNTNGTTLKTVEFSRLNSDGTMNSWQMAAADGVDEMAFGRASFGGVMSGIWGGYLYVAGGCNTVTSGWCSGTSAINSDVQIASINSDGTLDTWNTMAYVNHQRIGASFIAWQDVLYRFGGCSRQNTSGDCYATHKDIQYGPINNDGDASTVSVSEDPGSGKCVDPDPYDCSLPPGGAGSGQGGQMLVSTAILNGFMYVIGGCTTYQCNAMSDNTSYAAVDSNGRLKSPPTCAGVTNGAWCVDETNTIDTNGNAAINGVGGAATAVFGGYVYVIGGHQGNGTLKNAVYRNKANADGSWQGAWVEQRMTTQLLTNTLAMANAVTYTYAYARANPANAGTIPGNLYIFAGCTALSSGNCSTYTQNVYKCNIMADGSLGHDAALSGTDNRCSTSGQLNIGTVSGASGVGLGQHAGAVYANYIYLVGGNAPGTSDLTSIRYAKFDNSNNIVTVGSGWVTTSESLTIGRARGSAFGYNGYLYVVGGYNSGIASTLRDIQFAKINVGTGDIDAFDTSIVTINQRWGLGLAVSNSYAYVIGGCNSGTPPSCATTGLDDTVQTFQMYNNDSGAPARYISPNTSNMFATDRLGAGTAVHNGYIYIAGGCTGSTECASTTDDVQSAPIDANGNVGTWTAMTGSGKLTAARGFGQLEVVGGTLYFMGGQTGSNLNTAEDDIYYAVPNGSGVISSWSIASGLIGDTSGGAAVKRTQFSTAVWNNRIYITGGYNESSAVQTSVFVSPSLSSGGNIAADSWTSLTGFNVARSGNVVITYANNIYILGGYDGTNYLSDVQYNKITESGGTVSLGTWTYTTNMPSPIRQADGFAVNGYMYIFGGRASLNDCAARTLVAPISANSTIASGNNPSGIGEWYQTNRNFDGGRYGLGATQYQGKAYLLGGGCQGVVMQDDFDSGGSPYYDAGQWSAISNMAADYRCVSNSITRTLSGTTGGTGGAVARTKSVNVASGGSIYFKLYTPTANIDTGGGTCYTLESPLILTRDGVRLQYCTTTCGTEANWTGNNIGAQYAAVVDPMQPFVVTIPAAAQTANTEFRWFIENGAATDSFALEDVYIVATSSTTMAYPTNSRVTQTGFLSQPQIAIYSRQIDAGSDVFPTKWLMNGIDNSIGARWQLKYRSMNDPLITDADKACGGSAMSSYGQTTNVGDVTLATPGTYTVKNSGGTNIGCGRYFFLTISVDASQTYGYPDDIGRGPTLDNLTLFYKSNPGRRLIHGKTFTEGIQQPLDTQPD